MTATDPAMPMTKGVRPSFSPRNADVLECRAPTSAVYICRSADSGR